MDPVCIAFIAVSESLKNAISAAKARVSAWIPAACLSNSSLVAWLTCLGRYTLELMNVGKLLAKVAS